MTLTIDLTVAEEAHLNAAARNAGVAPQALLKNIVESLAAVEFIQTPDPAARAAAIQAARGSLAHVGATVGDLHRQRQADKAHEDRLQ